MVRRGQTTKQRLLGTRCRVSYQFAPSSELKTCELLERIDPKWPKWSRAAGWEWRVENVTNIENTLTLSASILLLSVILVGGQLGIPGPGRPGITGSITGKGEGEEHEPYSTGLRPRFSTKGSGYLPGRRGGAAKKNWSNDRYLDSGICNA